RSGSSISRRRPRGSPNRSDAPGSIWLSSTVDPTPARHYSAHSFRPKGSFVARTDVLAAQPPEQTHLARELTLLGLVATAFGAMIGIGINILPFMLQRSQPGVGGYVPVAYLVAAVPASLAALCYALLASAM